MCLLTYCFALLCRSYKCRTRFLFSSQKNMLDGELLWSFLQLSSKKKADFAKQIGTSPAQLMEDMKDIDKITSHF